MHHIVLTPRKMRRHRVRIIADPLTGLPVLSAGPDAPLLRSKEVNAILATQPGRTGESQAWLLNRKGQTRRSGRTRVLRGEQY
jgi:hypothetical protein